MAVVYKDSFSFFRNHFLSIIEYGLKLFANILFLNRKKDMIIRLFYRYWGKWGIRNRSVKWVFCQMIIKWFFIMKISGAFIFTVTKLFFNIKREYISVGLIRVLSYGVLNWKNKSFNFLSLSFDLLRKLIMRSISFIKSNLYLLLTPLAGCIFV